MYHNYADVDIGHKCVGKNISHDNRKSWTANRPKSWRGRHYIRYIIRVGGDLHFLPHRPATWSLISDEEYRFIFTHLSRQDTTLQMNWRGSPHWKTFFSLLPFKLLAAASWHLHSSYVNKGLLLLIIISVRNPFSYGMKHLFLATKECAMLGF